MLIFTESSFKPNWPTLFDPVSLKRSKRSVHGCSDYHPGAAGFRGLIRNLAVRGFAAALLSLCVFAEEELKYPLCVKGDALFGSDIVFGQSAYPALFL